MASNKIALSIRIDLPNGSRFGPGKADILTAIDAEGSISAAAKALEMSYPRALRLVNEMNSQFAKPLVLKFQGGANRGGAHLSDLGQDVLQIYREIVKDNEGEAGLLLARLEKMSTK